MQRVAFACTGDPTCRRLYLLRRLFIGRKVQSVARSLTKALLFDGPIQVRAVRGTGADCEAATPRNHRGSPWPDLGRPSTSSARRSWPAQDVDARDEPGQRAFGTKIRGETLARTA